MISSRLGGVVLSAAALIAVLLAVSFVALHVSTAFLHYLTAFAADKATTSSSFSSSAPALRWATKPITVGVSDNATTHVLEADNRDHCFVTAYVDLGRDRWNDTPRSTDEYMTRFRRLVASVAEPLVVFIDTRHVAEVQALLAAAPRPRGLYTALVPVDEAFLATHIHAWSLLPREREIMARYVHLR